MSGKSNPLFALLLLSTAGRRKRLLVGIIVENETKRGVLAKIGAWAAGRSPFSDSPSEWNFSVSFFSYIFTHTQFCSYQNRKLQIQLRSRQGR